MQKPLPNKYPRVKFRLYIIFALLVGSLLVTFGIILHKEANPEWLNYQKAYFGAERQEVIKALAHAAEKQRKILQERLRYLDHPSYRIKQIFLEHGNRVDRCITCHLDLKQLEKNHPQIERYPFEEYGCTVCQ